MGNNGDTTLWVENYKDEINSAYLYRYISSTEKSDPLKIVYRKMAESEERHADIWEKRLREAGITQLPTAPDGRTRILSVIARIFGAQPILAILMGGEKKATQNYSVKKDEIVTGMANEEKSHERLMRHMAGNKGAGLEGGVLAQLEGRHRSAGGNALRAAVLGANDGLVSNLSLVMGVAGAALSGKSILITGFAGLLAGAASMALGEWLSVQSSRELYEHQLEIERYEVENIPEEEETELALIYQAKGLVEEQAKILAHQIMSNPTTSVDTLAREELGIDPEELGGSAWEAAITSFVLFSIGAIIPVFPYLFAQGYSAIGLSLAVSAVGLFVIGSSITLMTGKNWIKSGIRQVVFGLIAAMITYGVGRLIGVSLAG